MTNKEKYRELCKREGSIPVFMRDWWMDAVCNEDWDVIIYEENNRIISALPYFLNKKYGFRSIIPPHLSPISGIWILYPENINLITKYSYEEKLNEYFAKEIDKLKLDYFYLHFHHKYKNFLALYWNGFKQTTRYTYRITTLEDLDSTFKNFHPKLRKSIRQARETLSIIEDISVEDFYRVNSLTFLRQGIKVPYSLELVRRIIDSSRQNNALNINAAIDKEGNIHAVLLTVFDENTCYSLISGANPEFRDSGATSLLNWRALEIANARGVYEFDFTGSMLRPIEKYMRHFSSEQTPYFAIEKNYSWIYSLLRKIRR